MEESTSDKTLEIINNSNSIEEKLRMLPSTAQSRGLPAMAPVYRVRNDRKRFTYLSYYPKEEKHSFPLKNIEKPPPAAVVQNIIAPKKQKPMEKLVMKKPLHFYREINDKDLLLKSHKRCPVVRRKQEKMLEPSYCVTFVYTSWPEPKGYPPEFIRKKIKESSRCHPANATNLSK